MHSCLWNAYSQILLKFLHIGEMEIYFHEMTIGFSLLQSWHCKQHTDEGMTSCSRSKALTKMSQSHHTIFVSRYDYHVRTKKSNLFYLWLIFLELSLTYGGSQILFMLQIKLLFPFEILGLFQLVKNKLIKIWLCWGHSDMKLFLPSFSVHLRLLLLEIYILFSAKCLSITSLLVLKDWFWILL